MLNSDYVQLAIYSLKIMTLKSVLLYVAIDCFLLFFSDLILEHFLISLLSLKWIKCTKSNKK